MIYIINVIIVILIISQEKHTVRHIKEKTDHTL